MAERGTGTFIITGGMPEPKPAYVSLSLGKAGVRTLVTLLDQQYGAAGIHAATVTVVDAVAPGLAGTRRTSPTITGVCTPSRAAEWEHEVVY